MYLILKLHNYYEIYYSELEMENVREKKISIDKFTKY